MSLYAWAASVRADEAPALAARFPGLGLVLYPQNVSAVEHLAVPPIAYVGSLAHAETVRAWIEAGHSFRAVIVKDELNADGPSGRYLAPEAYAEAFVEIRSVLEDWVPVHTMGLQPVGGWWEELFRSRKFDDAYHAQLPIADGWAFNPNKVQLKEVGRVLREYPGPWVLSPAPFRTWWDRLWEPVSVKQWARVSAQPNVSAVAMWCLREVHGGPWFGDRWQHEHGLIDRHGNVTNVGREVHRILGGT